LISVGKQLNELAGMGKFYRYRLSAIADFEANGGTGE
jgi:hypothetical protein